MEIKNYVNKLFSQLINYLDSSENAFRSDFPGSFHNRIFELVMGDFIIKNGYELLSRDKKTGQPDWKFKNNEQTYYLECATRSTNEMDKFAELLPNVECYLEAANIFLDKFKELASQPRSLWTAEWFIKPYLELIPGYFNETQITKLLAILNTENLPSAIFKFKEWIYYNRYARVYFSELIPNKLNEKLINIFGKDRSIEKGLKEIISFKKCLIESSAQSISDKLRKEYCKRDIPTILAVSLAAPDFRTFT